MKDPLAWEWSTHRDVMGAVADPWVDAERLAAALGHGRGDFRPWFHRLVSDDRHAATGGTPLPVATPPSEFPTAGLDALAAAATAAHRADPGDWRSERLVRRTFLGLARRQGWHDDALLARALGVSYWTVRRTTSQALPAHVEAAALCLGDSRLLVRTDHPGGG